MLETIKISRRIIIAMLIVMIVTAISPIIVLGANEKNLPVITPMQRAGEIKAGQELKFKITDDTKVSYIFYAWNRRTDGGKSTCIELEKEEPEYEFKINAPTQPGLYEFSIAAEDYYGNTTYWMNIPYVVKNNLSGVQDNTAPEFIFNTPNEYPYNDSTIPQEMPITIRAKDPSGIYYIGYKWTRELETKVTGATLVYKKDTVQITAPKEQGVWYLILYARDGSNNLSECYYTRVTVGKANYDMSGIKFEDKAVTYNGQAQSLAISGNLPEGVTVSYEGNGKTEVGEYTVTAKFAGDTKNYNAISDKTAKLTINKANYDITGVKFIGTEATYDGTAHNIAVDEKTLPEGVTVTGYIGNGQTSAGEHKVKVTFAGDENHEKIEDIEVTLKITPKTITVIGDAENGEDYTNNVLLGEDTLESIGVIDTLTTTATSSIVGDYSITGIDGKYGNYVVTVIPGTYTIIGKEITVIVEDKTSEYGAANLETLTARLAVVGDEENGEDYTNNILEGTDTLESIGVIASLSTTATTSSSVGNYAITGESKIYGNYTVTVKSGTYKITEKAITVIAEDKTSEYGVENLEKLTARLAVAGDAQNGEDYTKKTP